METRWVVSTANTRCARCPDMEPSDFKARCMKALEQNGDVAMDFASHEDAVAHYSTALSLDPLSAVLLTKRSKAHARIGSWQDSLEDADAVRVS